MEALRASFLLAPSSKGVVVRNWHAGWLPKYVGAHFPDYLKKSQMNAGAVMLLFQFFLDVLMKTYFLSMSSPVYRVLVIMSLCLF